MMPVVGYEAGGNDGGRKWRNCEECGVVQMAGAMQRKEVTGRRGNEGVGGELWVGAIICGWGRFRHAPGALVAAKKIN